MNTKCTKWTQNVPNGNKISQKSVKYSKWPFNISTLSNLGPSKIYTNWDFGFEKKPSGNPGSNLAVKILTVAKYLYQFWLVMEGWWVDDFRVRKMVFRRMLREERRESSSFCRHQNYWPSKCRHPNWRHKKCRRNIPLPNLTQPNLC
jgi:hypothetical protein